MKFEPIAVIGYSCIMPGALTPKQLLDNSLQNKICFSPALKENWGVNPEFYLSEHAGIYKLPTVMSGYIQGFQQAFDKYDLPFDKRFISHLDVLYHWLFYTAHTTLRNANYLEKIKSSRINAIFGNLSYPTKSLLNLAKYVWLSQQDDPILKQVVCACPNEMNRFMSGYPAHLLMRLLKLNGEAFALDAACASSLYAIKLACDQLNNNEADLVLAGGINATEDMFLHTGFNALNALSKNGDSLPFNKNGSGLIPAQGAGFIALKKLAHAIRDHDSIKAVIRGVGLSNDGNSGGLLAPAKCGQLLALNNAYQNSEIDPNEIDFIDCHATGTVVGDSIEIEALSAFFKDNNALTVAALKANIGHTLTASGVAAVIRSIEAINAHTLPPTRSADNILPLLESSRFQVLLAAKEWEAKAHPRRAGINSFGMGGNNAHLIVEEWRSSFSLKPPTRAPLTSEDDNFAIVGINLLTAKTNNLVEFSELLLNKKTTLTKDSGGQEQAKIDAIELPLVGIRFPPNDLKNTQAQQLAILKCGIDVLNDVKEINLDKTSIIIGMQCDPSIASFSLSAQLQQLLQQQGHKPTAEWLKQLNTLIGAPTSAHVLGAMPNIIASRLNFQLNSSAPSFSVSDEELSGITALEIGMKHLKNNEIDAALIGAVDFSCNEIDEYVKKINPENTSTPLGDAAVVMVVKRLPDAIAHKDTIYAIVSNKSKETENNLLKIDNLTYAKLFGHAHCASGLLTLAAAALTCHHHSTAVTHAEENLTAAVNITSFSGKSKTMYIKGNKR